jgi:hypothetical protein
MECMKLFEEFHYDFLKDLFIEYRKILHNYSPEVVKININGDFFEILVKDKKSGMKFWVDVSINEGEFSLEWNQYIFTNSDDDIIRKNLQKDNLFYMDTLELIDGYLLTHNYISLDDEGHYIKII